ncbi:hypothetical protein [Nonomuraea sp. NPDC049646]|uniref:hypothetical protein n=1 Tax=unclassified Nonomuraea TaxID=2593643 RepID=UPI0037B0DE64
MLTDIVAAVCLALPLASGPAVPPDRGYGIAVMANTGTAFGDARALMDGLVALVEGGTPEIPSSPPYLVTDILFVLLALATVGLAVRGVARSRRWAVVCAGWRRWRLLPLPAPLALCVTIVPIMRVLLRGGDIMWIQVVCRYPTFMIWLVTAAVAGTTVTAARLHDVARTGS